MGRKRKSVTPAEDGSAKLAKVDSSLNPSVTVRVHVIQNLSLS